jgi:hypothetical protein
MVSFWVVADARETPCTLRSRQAARRLTTMVAAGVRYSGVLVRVRAALALVLVVSSQGSRTEQRWAATKVRTPAPECLPRVTAAAATATRPNRQRARGAASQGFFEKSAESAQGAHRVRSGQVAAGYGRWAARRERKKSRAKRPPAPASCVGSGRISPDRFLGSRRQVARFVRYRLSLDIATMPTTAPSHPNAFDPSHLACSIQKESPKMPPPPNPLGLGALERRWQW